MSDSEDPWYSAPAPCAPPAVVEFVGNMVVGDTRVRQVNRPSLDHNGKASGWLVRSSLRVQAVLMMLHALQSEHPHLLQRWVDNCKVFVKYWYSSMFDCSSFWRFGAEACIFVPLQYSLGLDIPPSLHVSCVSEKVPWRLHHCIAASRPDVAVTDICHLKEFLVPNVVDCSDYGFRKDIKQSVASMGQWTFAGSMCNDLSKRNPKRRKFSNTMRDASSQSGATFGSLMEVHSKHKTLGLTWEMVLPVKLESELLFRACLSMRVVCALHLLRLSLSLSLS